MSDMMTRRHGIGRRSAPAAGRIERAHRRRSKPHGITLVEIVIAMLLLLLGLLGMIKLQSDSLKASYASLQRAIVTVRLQDVMERTWASVCVMDLPNAISIVDEAKSSANASGINNIARWEVPSNTTYDTSNYTLSFNYRWWDHVNNGYSAYQAYSFRHPDC